MGPRKKHPLFFTLVFKVFLRRFYEVPMLPFLSIHELFKRIHNSVYVFNELG